MILLAAKITELLKIQLYLNQSTYGLSDHQQFLKQKS